MAWQHLRDGSVVATLCALVGWAGAPRMTAADAEAAFRDSVRPLLAQYCFDCHGEKRQRGGLSLEEYETPEALHEDRDVWAEILRRIQTGEMPPVDKSQPTPDEKQQLIDWIQAELFPVDCANPDPGRVTIRRLNRTEYRNTLRDLLGVEFNAAEMLPPDDSGYGFDNIGDALSLTPLLLERYLAAAQNVLDQVIFDSNAPRGSTVSYTGTQLLLEDGSNASEEFAALPSAGEVSVRHTVSEPGQYSLLVHAFAQQAGPERARMGILRDGSLLTNVEVAAVASRPGAYSIQLRLPAGQHRLAASFLNDYYNPADPNPEQRDRNLYIVGFELNGPLDAPPPPSNEFQRRYLKCPSGHEHSKQCLRTALAPFAKRAFRRPATDGELERLVSLAENARSRGGSFEGGVKLAMQAVLVSPHFLFRGEIGAAPDDPVTREPISEYALASRLSYFLWSTTPDDTLLELADRNELRRDLSAQVSRMLRDGRARALAENFAGQWLQTRNLSLAAPDAQVFPRFNAELRDAMEQETLLFFDYVRTQDRSLLDFLTGDYTFLNARLAQHYGLAAPLESGFQKVSLKGTPRTGVMTHGSILTVTSNPNRTSPVKRGKWVLENLLGQPPPPPPPNVPALPETAEASATASLRERMELHRSDPACASCHAQMDPIGFSLENFDGIGTWRTEDGNFKVEASGKLPSGEQFVGATELSVLLADRRRDQFVKCLTEKMLTYALGRGLEYYDRCAVERITERLARENYRFSALIEGITTSVPFQMARGDGDSEAPGK